MLKIKKILIPVDFSKEAELAVEWAIRLARERKKTSLVLLHSLSPVPVFPEAGVDAGVVLESQLKRANTKLRRWLKKIPPMLKAYPICAEGYLPVVVEEIVRKQKIDLVVMTTHGRHGLTRVVHPNVTELVVRSASCPVLVLHLNKFVQKK